MINERFSPSDDIFSLHFCREKEPIIYDGDLMDEEGVLDFLTSLEAMDLPDRIEEVNAKILGKIIEETDYVAVLFCKFFFCLLIIRKKNRPFEKANHKSE